MKHLLFLICLLPFISFGQMEIETTKYNFGDLYDNAPTYVDFVFTNKGDKDVFLLTIDRPQEVNYLFSKKFIQPDSSVIIRLAINDRISGRFNYDVDVYFSDSNKPITLNLSGNVKEKSSNPLTACPDFNSTPPKNGVSQFEITIKVVDSLTHEPIRRSKVYLINNGDLIGTFWTNNDGIIHVEVPIGYYYVTAQHKSYESNSREGYFNFQSNYLEIPLQSPDVYDNPEILVEEDPIIVQEEVETTNPIEVDLTETESTETNEIEEVTKTTTDTTEFNSANYVANNIVFVVDVSSSMNGMGKLDLLKYSMIELTKVLRPEDRVTLIAYSGSVRVLLDNVSGAEKDLIIEQVKSLDAKGYTAGGDAIKEAYRLAQKSYIDGGNNQVFMVTDGAFNKGDKNYKKIITNNYEKNGIKFSVVGIKTSEFLSPQMISMAKLGGGDYVRIISIEDAQTKLLNEIKRHSYTGRLNEEAD